MGILEVGINKEYITVQSAVTAATNNDIILIYPGIYDEIVVVNKIIHLCGNTNNPVSGDVSIVSDYGTPLSINCDAVTSGTIYIEKLKLVTTSTSYIDSSFKIPQSNTNLHLVMNRCVLRAVDMNTTNILFEPSQTCGSIVVSSCYLESTGLHIEYLNDVNFSSVIKTECNKIFEAGNGDPIVNDTVNTSTYGYGPNYGNNNITPYMYYFSGYTTKLNLPVSRVVKAFTEDKYAYSPIEAEQTYTCVGETLSSGGGGWGGYFYLQTTFSGAHQVICEDDEDGVKYNDLIFSDVYPATVSGFSGLP